MSIFWVHLAMFVSGMIVYLLYTFVFCFWFIYLVDAMKRKRSFHKSTLRCVQGEPDPHEQMLAYNAKTEFVKFVFLFCLNLTEWVGATFASISFTLHFVRHHQQESQINTSLPVFSRKDSVLHLPYLHNMCIVISMAHVRQSVYVFISEICTKKLDEIKQHSILDLFLLVEFVCFTDSGCYMLYTYRRGMV